MTTNNRLHHTAEVHPAGRRLRSVMPYAGMSASECAAISYTARRRLDARLNAHKTARKLGRIAALSQALGF